MSQQWAADQVVVGEAVALELRPAAIPSRIVAGALDGLLQLVLLGVLALVVGLASGGTSEAGTAALVIVTLVVVVIVYPVGFETVLRGRTPGKAALGLRVVRDDGGPIGFRHALVRGLAGAFLERPGITVFVAGVVTSLLNGRGKRLGDLLAGTVVLQERVPVRGGPVAAMPPPLAGWAAGLDLSGLTDDLALQVRQLVARSAELTPAAREQLGSRMVAAVTAAVQPPPPPGTPGWAVLSAVLAERRRREELRLGGRQGGQQGGQQPPPPAAPPGWSPQPPSSSPPLSSPPSPPPSSSPPAAPSSSDVPRPTAGGFAPPG